MAITNVNRNTQVFPVPLGIEQSGRMIKIKSINLDTRNLVQELVLCITYAHPLNQ